ncbi:MAG: Fur family transcriptional regulator, partial [Solirubrobacterales bacterium]
MGIGPAAASRDTASSGARRGPWGWGEHALRSLSEAGYRSGGSRRRVVELLASESCALTALEIDRRLERVGRASVYRALEQLEALNLVQRVDLGADSAGFERVDPGGHHHHHLVCETCGTVAPFIDERLEGAIESI